MVGASDEEAIPSHMFMTLFYVSGKILDISYGNIKSHIMKFGKKVDVYTDKCFTHILAAYFYLKKDFINYSYLFSGCHQYWIHS